MEKYAPEWSEESGVRFLFLDTSGPADIVVSFKQGDHASQSTVGHESYSDARKGIPTMNLNFAKAVKYCGGGEAGMRRVILHEFGHALGLHHEQASPSIAIDRAAMRTEVKSSLKRRYKNKFKNTGLTDAALETKITEEIERNYPILSSDRSLTNFSKFDPETRRAMNGFPTTNGCLLNNRCPLNSKLYYNTRGGILLAFHSDLHEESIGDVNTSTIGINLGFPWC